MSNAHKQQVNRDRAKAKLSVIKAKLRPTPREHTEADRQANRQAERLRRLLTVYPMFSAQFDTWVESRKEQLRRG
jgi:hypothetical protein